MSDPIHYGLEAGSFYPQPDFTAYQDERGGWRAYQSFACLAVSLKDDAFRNNFVAGATPSSLDPSVDTYWDALGLSYVSWDREPGGRATIRVFYAGFSASGSGGPDVPAPQYSLRAEFGERSLMEHPDLFTLGDEEKSLLREIYDGRLDYSWDSTNSKVVYRDPDDANSLKRLVDQPTTTALTFAKKIMIGIRTYRHPTFVWTKNWNASSGIPVASLNNVGKIDTPDGDYPAVTGTRDWLLTGADQWQEGNLYRNRLEWTLSEAKGWDSDIYS